MEAYCCCLKTKLHRDVTGVDRFTITLGGDCSAELTFFCSSGYRYSFQFCNWTRIFLTVAYISTIFGNFIGF